MDAKVIIKTSGITKEELKELLQAIRTCEQEHFLDKRLYVWMDTTPELSMSEAKEILESIQPPWSSLEKF